MFISCTFKYGFNIHLSFSFNEFNLNVGLIVANSDLIEFDLTWLNIKE